MAKRHVHPRITVDILPMETNTVADEDSDGEGTEFDDRQCVRNLLDDFLVSKQSIEPPPNEHMKVYLRIRPFSDEELKRNDSQSCLTVDNERTVATVPPKDSHYYKATTRGLCKSTMKYTFSHIFSDLTTQKQFFNDVMLDLVKDFIGGQNCLIFSYGVTSSGKTYTIQGNPKDAGILPRTLDVLFNSIGGQQWDHMNLKPKMFNGVSRLSQEHVAMERRAKQKVLKLSCEDDMDVMSLLGDDASDISVATNTTVNTTTCSESSNMSMMNPKDSLESTEKLFEELSERIREETMVNVEDQGSIRFSVWVSFAEIYNEQIFDLLEPMPKKKNERRAVLKLSEDKKGCPYIKGLKEINVTSADEAFKLLTIGQRNLQTACTKLNHNSSRGHCIFNMKIIRVHDKDNPHLARVSMLSLCDLAGSERYSKTQSDGDRLKEAGNINTSLLTLGRCIETLRHNQHHKDNPRIIPFRESKLTRLFQNFFSGQGKAAMIVNVNQCASMFDETQHVFKFSAVASQVVVPPKPIFVKPKLPVVVPSPNRLPRVSSICWATPGPSSKIAPQQVAENIPLPEEDEDDLEEQIYTQDNIDVNSSNYSSKGMTIDQKKKTIDQDEVEELLAVIEQLQGELTNEVATRNKTESRIRNEVCDEMKQQFIEIEEAYSEQIRVREQMAEDLAEKRMQILMDAERAKRERNNMMKDGEDEWVSSLLMHQEKVKVEERNTTIKNMKTDVCSLKTKVSDLTKAQEKSAKERENLQKQLHDAMAETDRLQKLLASSHENTAGLESELSKAAKDAANVKTLEKQIGDYEGKISSLEQELVKFQNERNESDETGKAADIVENLTQQLQQARQHIEDQEKETSELNDMLTEAGETFEQREAELQKLTELTREYERRMEEQAEAIKVLERAATDSRVAMETADQSLSKREDCVSTLQAEIRSLEGEVSKYRNKARFFEEQLVGKEQEVDQYKQKYNQDKEEHSKNQEALIHGFTAEISNLKSQIFHFKTQLYGSKSPTKSPGGIRSDKHIQLPLSPLAIDDNGSYKNDVNKQVLGLQSEMNKSCSAISDLEHALQLSKVSVHELESKLASESVDHIKSQKRVEELEKCLKRLTEHKSSNDDNEKKSKVESLNEEIVCKNKTLINYENRIKKLEIAVSEMNIKLEEKNKEIAKFEERKEELDMLNTGLKDIVNKTTVDLQMKEKELEILSPHKSRVNVQMYEAEEAIKRLKAEIDEKNLEIELLTSEVGHLKAGCNTKEDSVADQSNFEFRYLEMELENQELKNKCENTIEIDDMKFKLNELTEQLAKAGEELAIVTRDVSKLKRETSESEAIIKTKDTELNDLTSKLQDVVKEKKLLELKLNAKDTDIHSKDIRLKHEMDRLRSKLEEMETEKGKLEEQLNANVSAREEMLKLESLLKGKDESINELTEQFIGQTSESEAIIKTKDTEFNDLTSKLQDVVKEKKLLELKLNAKDTDIHSKDIRLKHEMDCLRSKLEEIETEKGKLEEQLNANVSAREEMLKLESLLKGKDERIHDLTEQLKSVSKEAQSLMAHSDCKAKIERLELLLQEKDEELTMFSQNLDAILEERENCDLHKDKEVQLSKKVDHLEGQLKELSEMETKTVELEECVVQLESAVTDKEVEICDRDKMIETINTEIKIINSKVVDLEKETKELKIKLEDAQKTEYNQNDKIAELTKLLASASESTITVEELQKEIVETNEKLENVETDNLEESKNLKTCLEEKNKKISKLTEESEIADEAIRNLEKEIQMLKDKLVLHDDLQNRVHTLEAKLKESVEENFTLQDNVEEKNRQLEQMHESYTKLNSQLEVKDNSKLTDAMMEIAELKSSVHTHTTLHHKVKGELQEALLEVENSRSEIRSLKQQKENVNKFEYDLQAKIQEIASLNGDIAELKQTKEVIVELEEDIKKYKHQEEVHLSTVNELEKARIIVSDLQTENNSLKDELLDKTKKLCHLEKASEDIAKQIKESMDSYNQLKKEHDNLKMDSDRLLEKNTALCQETSELKACSGTEVDKLRKEHENDIKDLKDQIEKVNKFSENSLVKFKDLKTEHEDELKQSRQVAEFEINRLKELCDESTNDNHLLKEKICELKHSDTDLTVINKQLLDSSDECLSLRKKLDEVEDHLKSEQKKTHLAKEELIELKQELDACKINIENDKLTKHVENDSLRKLEELQRLYEAEKLKNDVYRKGSDTEEPDFLSPQRGVRKLRKEKMEIQNSLIEAKFKIDTLENKLRAAELSEKCNENYQLNSKEQIPSHDPLLQRKLSKMSSKLQEAESTIGSLRKEVTELQGTIEKLEGEIQKERDKNQIAEKDLCRKSTTATLQADPRQSISSPSSSQELNKSREREQRLHEQLNNANMTIQEWRSKLREIENSLQIKTRELHSAHDTIQQLEKQRFEGRAASDREFEEYQERAGECQRKLEKSEEDVETKTRMIEDLERQLQSKISDMKAVEKDMKEQSEVISVLKETLSEQEDMLQVQENFINNNESELASMKDEHQALLEKYQAKLETKDTSQQEHLQETKLAVERDILKGRLDETERKLQRLQEEKVKINSILADNNREVKEMEKALSESKRECEELRQQGADRHAETRLEDLRHDLEKSIHDLQAKNRTQSCQIKELGFKLSTKVEKLKAAEDGQKIRDAKLKDFREERDKLVSGLEAILKKKDVEIKQLKEVLKQLKDREIQLSKSWQEEREKIGSGLQQQNTNFTIKMERPDYVEEGEPIKSPAGKPNVPTSPLSHKSPTRQNSQSRPPRPEPPKMAPAPVVPDMEHTEIQALQRSPGSRRTSRIQPETPSSVRRASTLSRKGSRRGRKRNSPVHGDDDLPPLPKRVSVDSSLVSESDDISSHLAVDATPPVAAKTLRRTRKKYGSTLDVSTNEDNETAPAPKRTTRTAKRSAKSRILESFRESPIGKGSKRILDNIAETFSPNKSPTKEETGGSVVRKGSAKSRLINKDTISSPIALEMEPKPAGRGKGRHKLYKEDTYISEPFENTTEFVKSPDNIHTTVTRSLRSRRH